MEVISDAHSLYQFMATESLSNFFLYLDIHFNQTIDSRSYNIYH